MHAPACKCCRQEQHSPTCPLALCCGPGLHIMPGAHQAQVPSHYSIVPGRDFLQSLSTWDINRSTCPAQYWSSATAKCNVTGDVATVAAACDALPACNGCALHPRRASCRPARC